MQKAVLGLVAAAIVLAASAQERTPADADKAKPAVEKKEQARKGGRTNRSATHTRIKDEGIKLPPCAVESRESVDCPK